MWPRAVPLFIPLSPPLTLAPVYLRQGDVLHAILMAKAETAVYGGVQAAFSSNKALAKAVDASVFPSEGVPLPTLSAPLLPWVTPRGPQCVKCSRGGGCRCAATQYNTEVLPTSPQAGGLKLWSPTLF